MLKAEFQKEKFKFNHDHPDDFTTCFWQKKPKIVLSWIVYRFVLIVYFFYVVMTLVFNRPEKGYVWYKNVLYISTLTTFFELVLFSLASGLTVERFLKEKKNPGLPPLESMPWQYKTLWVLYDMTASNTMVVTVMFWLLFYRSDVDTDIMFLLTNRLFNFVVLIIDYFLSNIPFRLLHVYVPCIFTILYYLLTVIYQFSGGTGNLDAPSLYKIVNWTKPLKPILFMMLYLGLCVFSHCGMCTIYFLKLWLKSREH